MKHIFFEQEIQVQRENHYVFEAFAEVLPKDLRDNMVVYKANMVQHEPRLPRGHDARHPLRQHVCSACGRRLRKYDSGTRIKNAVKRPCSMTNPVLPRPLK